MNDFPTCCFLTTAFSESQEDIASGLLHEQSKEFLEVAQTFLANEEFFTVFDTFDTLPESLNEAAARKKGLIHDEVVRMAKKIEKYQSLNRERIDHLDLFAFKEQREPTFPLRWVHKNIDLAEVLLALYNDRALMKTDGMLPTYTEIIDTFSDLFDKRIGIDDPKITAHSLRHTCGSLMVEEGVPLGFPPEV